MLIGVSHCKLSLRRVLCADIGKQFASSSLKSLIHDKSTTIKHDLDSKRQSSLFFESFFENTAFLIPRGNIVSQHYACHLLTDAFLVHSAHKRLFDHSTSQAFENFVSIQRLNKMY